MWFDCSKVHGEDSILDMVGSNLKYNLDYYGNRLEQQNRISNAVVTSSGWLPRCRPFSICPFKKWIQFGLIHLTSLRYITTLWLMNFNKCKSKQAIFIPGLDFPSCFLVAFGSSGFLVAIGLLLLSSAKTNMTS